MGVAHDQPLGVQLLRSRVEVGSGANEVACVEVLDCQSDGEGLVGFDN